MNKQLRRWYPISLLIAVPLLILIVGEGQWSPPAAGATNTSASRMISAGTVAETTDVISVALSVAHSSGLVGDPNAMYISGGVYKDFRLPNTLASPDDSRRIWIVRLDAAFLFDGYGVTDMPVNYLYVYIDADTGLSFARSAGKSPIEQFSPQVWTKVTLSDIGKFPIPKFVPGDNVSTAPLRPTATPAQ